MQTTRIFKTAWLFAALSIAGWTTAQAQTVYNANWTGPTSGGDWNTASSWSTGVVPGSDINGITNAVIPYISTSSSNVVTYGSAMTATGFGGLTNFGVLVVSAAGFNNNGIFLDAPTAYRGWLFETNPAAVINVNGNLAITSNNIVNLGGGATMTVTGSILIGSNPTGGASSGNSGSIGIMTNSGAFLNASATQVNPVNSAGQSSTSQSSLLVISGGTNNLGTTTVKRSDITSGYATLGTEGLIIYGGLVIMTNLNAGGQGNGSTGASWSTTLIAGGTVTNFGNVYINNATAGRPSRVLQTGGLFVVPDPGFVNPNSTAAGTLTAVYSIQGGTNIIGGLYEGATNGVAATVAFTNAATIYVGSQGIATNGIVLFINDLKAGGMFGATAPWTGSAPMSFIGTGAFTFQTADMNGNPNNIILATNAVLSGPVTCALNVTGGGILTLGATNTYTGSTLINGGTLALGANGALASSTVIVGPGTKFDVSAVSAGFGIANLQTLAGLGVVTGAVSVASGGNISPGSNTLTGTLSFSNSVTETGGVINNFTLAGAPNPNNDKVIIAGDLDVSGTNNVFINGVSLVAGTNYVIIQYSGNFNGGLTNFQVVNAVGTLSNNATAKTISFIPQTTLRAPTNTVWIGNPVNTNWDNEVSTNWLNGANLDFFVPGDSVQFTDVGASNSPVNIVGTVQPTSVLVNSHSNYVFASTSGGWIGGTASLTVSNTGTLTVLTTNTYSGNTTIDGGSSLAVSQLAINGSPSAVGESDSLVINNGTFTYTGPNVSIDRGASLGNASSAINISANGNLTLGGNLVGNGGLTLVGPGNLILSGTSSFLGVTTLSNGMLQVNGTAALGANNVNFDGGTLKFSGEPGQEFYANVFNVATTGTMIFNDGNSDGIIGTSGGDGGFSGTGTLNLSITNASAYCTINAHMENFAGTLHVTDNSLGNFRLNSGGANNAPQICTGSTNATFDLGNGSVTLFNRNGGGSSGGTNYNVYDLGALAGGSTTKLSGGTTASIYSIGANNLNTIYSGTIQNGTGTVGITKVGHGTLTLSGINGYTGPTIVSNGVLALSYNPTNSTDGEISGSPTITIAAGTVLDVSGESAGTFALTSGHILQGNGTVNGILDATGGGTVAPGGITGNIGTLTVTGNIELGTGGTDWMKLNRAASPNSDRIVCSTGQIFHFGEALIVTNIGAPLQVNDTFTLFGGSMSGFNSYSSITLPGYYTWDTSQLSVNNSIKVTGILPHPSVTKTDFSGLAGGAITFYTTNGILDTAVNVLSTTNLASPLSSWTVVTNTTFNSYGDLNDPNDPDDPLIPHPGFTIQVNPAQTPRFFILQTLGY